ncbi:polysaccharide biosynthesis C-terminal domain-containing protein [Massilibacterium senegalense]|uniref:polysaccharide biosynthesis C-terminal domain-containing protein n=1 Tax=Massilibacterium senegalense TaxID=1632858 RepID=UPI0007804684|nr:NAD-dependent epimerase/dehydratase family protein [Massilibacterium senegalense]
MKILVTGAKGFIGGNLVAELKNRGYTEIYECTRETEENLLAMYTKKCNFVFHLAGINRPRDKKEFMEGNYEFTLKLLNLLKKHNNPSPVLFTSSIQAQKNNPYGESKRAGEKLFFSYTKETGVKTFIYRLPNIFGKWCKPNYNSVVATFCYNVSRDLEIQVSDKNVDLTLCYIDDVIEEFIKAMEEEPTTEEKYCIIPLLYKIKLGELADLIQSFKESRQNLFVPNLGDPLTKKLYSTYLSYLPEGKFSYPLTMHIDQRGSFTEFIKSPERGQVSVNISRPGITKGNHWHHTKNEKFLVVSGEGLIRFRKIDLDEIIEYRVSGRNLEVVDIPVGYVHSIVNVGKDDLVTLMWANEPFDPDKTDTYFLEV